MGMLSKQMEYMNGYAFQTDGIYEWGGELYKLQRHHRAQSYIKGKGGKGG